MTVYEKITSEKEASFGKTMTVKEACDLWWNSVRIQSYEEIIVWKNIDDNSYSCNIYDEYDEDDSEELKELLNKEITLESDYYYDEDGYPVVDAVFGKVEKKEYSFDWEAWQEEQYKKKAEKNRQKIAAKKMKEAMKNGTLNISVPDHDIFTFEPDQNTKRLVITGIKQTDITELEIPTSFDKRPITRVTKTAFEKLSKLEVLKINSVETQVSYCLEKCPNLRKIVIGHIIIKIRGKDMGSEQSS